MILNPTTGRLRGEILGTKPSCNTPGKSKYQTDRSVSENYLGLITEGHNEHIK